MDEDEMMDELVTLTRGQWQDLMGSIQQLSEANAMLARTVSCLLHRLVGTGDEEEELNNLLSVEDPYDLKVLRKLMNGVE